MQSTGRGSYRMRAVYSIEKNEIVITRIAVSGFGFKNHYPNCRSNAGEKTAVGERCA